MIAVVAVEEDEDLRRLRARRDGLDPRETGPSVAASRLGHDGRPPRAGDVRGRVGRAVVDDDDLLHPRARKVVEHARDPALLVEDGHDDAHPHLVGPGGRAILPCMDATTDRSSTAAAPSAAGDRTAWGVLVGLLRSMRPHQWTKNVFVFAALIFAQKFDRLDDILRATAAFGLFCALSGAVYIINDLVDREKDRAHPHKHLDRKSTRLNSSHL